jgi:hypothetical protein
MEDVLSVYHRPYDPSRPVVCVDEASKELHGTPAGVLPIEPGQPVRIDYEYERLGKRNIFLAAEPLVGRRHLRVTERRTTRDFASFLRFLVEEAYPDVDMIVLVTDNLNTHSPACLYECFDPEQAHRIAQKIEWHYTPEHGSWLNMAEIELSILSRQCLSQRIADPAILEQQARAWEQTRNKLNSRIDWQFTAADARIKLKRLYPIIT